MDVCRQLIADPKNDRFIRRIATCDEKWVYYRNSYTPKQSLDHRHPAKVVKENRFNPNVPVENFKNIKKCIQYMFGCDLVKFLMNRMKCPQAFVILRDYVDSDVHICGWNSAESLMYVSTKQSLNLLTSVDRQDMKSSTNEASTSVGSSLYCLYDMLNMVSLFSKHMFRLRFQFFRTQTPRIVAGGIYAARSLQIVDHESWWNKPLPSVDSTDCSAGNLHTIAESLMMPAIKDAAEVVFGGKSSKEIETIPLYNYTFACRVVEMSQWVKDGMIQKRRCESRRMSSSAYGRRGDVLSTTVPEFPAFRNIPARINSLRALPRAIRTPWKGRWNGSCAAWPPWRCELRARNGRRPPLDEQMRSHMQPVGWYTLILIHPIHFGVHNSPQYGRRVKKPGLLNLNATEIDAAELKLFRPLVGYNLPDLKHSEDIRKELNIQNTTETIRDYRERWQEYLLRMEEHRLPIRLYNYRAKGKRRIGRPRKHKRLRWTGHVARMGESRNAYRVLVGRPEGKRSLERPRCRWEDNIKMDLRKFGYDARDWINLAQDRGLILDFTALLPTAFTCFVIEQQMTASCHPNGKHQPTPPRPVQ
ncbi:hypothetical protein ANN_07899 [Periplaneta americana]|uniref:Uncharacterized protein n=1 Tax=Periplaneta americana TaxID=6978 RepID=A0ABQ8T1A5_PERAM|nr:hypothetical protein ANN_07899 [Periplaneta americana]